MSEETQTPFAVFPKVKGAVAYDVYMGRGGITVLDAYVPPETEPVFVGRFDRDGNRIETTTP